MYRAFPFNKDSTAQDLITEQQTLKGGETKFPFTLIHHWPYSQHFIFFITYDWAHKVTVFVPAGLVNLVEYNTFGPFVSYKENRVFGLWYLGQQQLIFFVTYESSH